MGILRKAAAATLLVGIGAVASSKQAQIKLKVKAIKRIASNSLKTVRNNGDRQVRAIVRKAKSAARKRHAASRRTKRSLE